MALADSTASSYRLGALAATAAVSTAATLVLYRNYLKGYPKSEPERPQLVLDAIKENRPIYYFGVGSNLSRKELENRSICGSKIHIISMEPCVIPDYRLAFNLKGFPPLEPAMGSLEPLPSAYTKENGVGNDENIGDKTVLLKRTESKPLRAYENEECHGALIQLSAEDYGRVYKSEGGGSGAMQGYEEIIVTCVPYEESHPPVQAVAFRAREHARLAQDPCPSKRYMSIIREGSKELGLNSHYQQWLADHPVQDPSPLLKTIAIHNIILTMTISIGLKVRIFAHLQSSLLFKVYVLPTEPRWKQVMGEVAAGVIMLPTAIFGFFFKDVLEMTGLMPPMLKKFVDGLK